MTQIFIAITTGAGTFPDPGDWNPTNNLVECIGAGSPGIQGNTSTGYSGGGGAGGAYAYKNNAILTFPVQYSMQTVGTSANATNFNVDPKTGITSSSKGAAYWAANSPNAISAPSGGSAANTTGGMGGGLAVGSADYYPAGYPGGSGGNGNANSGYCGGGGGGSGGPHGAGSAGATATTTTAPGGAADGGTIASVAAGQAGLSGTQWDATHGVGGGGGGAASSTVPGGKGGLYGGGGGGGFLTSGAGRPAGTSGQALIVITYTPFVPSAGTDAIIMA